MNHDPAFGWLPHDVHETPTYDLEKAAMNYIYYKKTIYNQSEGEILGDIIGYMSMYARRAFYDNE